MQSAFVKFLSLALVAILIVAGFYYGLSRGGKAPSLDTSQQAPRMIVKQSPVVAGIPAIPQGFPEDIPLEANKLVESATTLYPEQKAKQLSLSYQSDKTIGEKYAEYKSYLNTAGYKITEGNPESAIRSIFGKKVGANISIVISKNAQGTLVQVTYLLTGSVN